jgi:cell division protein FtsW
LIAVGSGGLFGLGLGQSKQKFFYLPQNYTDFIFAIFCEEMGLFGAIGVILLFLMFIGRGMRIARNAPDAFSMLLAAGIVSWIGFQAFLNISVVLGLLPTTGIPLPLISYGGTSMLVILFSVGLLLNISQYKRAA